MNNKNSLISKRDRKRFCNMCQEHGFYKRGKVFFRIYKENFLQVLSIEYEMRFKKYFLTMQLASMYGNLDSEHFYIGYSYPCYNISNLEGYRCNVVGDLLNGQDILLSQQLDILENRGFAFLDSVCSHSALLQQTAMLDSVEYGEEYYQSYVKIIAALVCENYTYAELCIQKILYQHVSKKGEYDFSFPFTNESYLKYKSTYPEKDIELLQIHDWIEGADRESITEYLQCNYENNCKLFNGLI